MRKVLFFLLICPVILKAQEGEFDMSAFEEAGDAKVYVNNKILGLSPTKLLNLSFDYAGENTWQTTWSEPLIPFGTITEKSTFSSNSGLRLETNYPIISNHKLIVNAYLNYRESNYSARKGGSKRSIGQLFNQNGLRNTALGALIFKPLNEKNFLLFQVEGALNGNYNFGNISPEFSKLKFSAAALYGWKTNDYTNMAVGLTRTYGGGRLLHLPVFMFNKTFNNTWGLEMLLPARAALRRNFSSKSILKLGYELEGQSYHIQSGDIDVNSVFRGGDGNDWELRKSEIRPRISWDKSITDFIWFNVQAGAVITYRMDVDREAGASDAWLKNSPGIPFYFRFGIQLVSP